jgi:hypothetical protein
VTPAVAETASATSLRASRSLSVLDVFRTPYAVDAALAGGELERLIADGGRGALLWPAERHEPRIAAHLEVRGREAPIPIFARVLGEPQLAALRPRGGGAWWRARAITDSDGVRVASIWRSEEGDVLLPFDPDDVVESFWSERYGAVGRGRSAGRLKRAAMAAYYRLRPLMPRALQIGMRRLFARLQVRARFPRWPAEPALHDFYEVVIGLLAEVSRAAVPCLASWPDGHDWAFVLTHDVELTLGYEHLDPVLELERAHGLRSSWNFVPRRYPIDDARLRELVDAGFEVGVHGLYHDGRDLESLDTLRERLPGIREAAERWGAVGFRSPATHRAWEWMPLLGFDYDCSSPDTDPFEPQAGGCCSWLPFFNGDMVELPMTMAQDHTLFAILRHHDESIWMQKSSLLRERGGMALIDTHPDYLVDERILRAYGRLLERWAGDETAWKALPREVSAWWRRRAASVIVATEDGWEVAGPAAGRARIELLEGRW